MFHHKQKGSRRCGSLFVWLGIQVSRALLFDQFADFHILAIIIDNFIEVHTIF